MEINGRFYINVIASSTPTYIRNGKWFVEVEGYRLPRSLLPGYEGLDLFIHRGIRCPDWFVSEGKTGLRVGRGEDVLEACRAAEALLEQFGLQTFRARIEAAIKITGLSPRYAGAGQGKDVLEACHDAEALLMQYRLQTLMDRIEAEIKITGLSPRYVGAGEPAVAAAPHPPSENTSSAEIMGDSQPEASNKITGPSSDLPGCG